MRRLPALFPAVLAASLLGAAGTAAQTAAASHFPPDADLQVMLQYLVDDGETPGIVLGILEADGSTRIFSAGSAGPGARPLGPRTTFEIGSINKTFTGTILADMVAKGEVALDDPVQKYLPEGVRVPSRNGRQITLLDLATHRSGLPRLPDNFTPADPTNPYADYSVEQLYAFLNHHQLRRDIGAEFEYSNLGMGLLGHALGRAAGTNVQTLIRQRILEPLGMRLTSYARDGEVG
ncbi:MAG TPA: serine hydrolase domain-containing protein, partial [Longimicrobiaceae bacterium]|nr:serine hydrolase domain-containing protein [Longimicrobiaceae bacterium]